MHSTRPGRLKHQATITFTLQSASMPRAICLLYSHVMSSNFLSKVLFTCSLMALVSHRTQTDVQLWMNSATGFALCFQDTRLPDASHAGKIEHDTQGFHPHCCPTPRGKQEPFHCHGNSTLQFGDHCPKCQHELALVHSPLLKESFAVCSSAHLYA